MVLLHVDCNNFFVSCERLFRPDLQKKPVVVLSNNEGCAIARSEEAKALGIAMCQPYFQFQQLEKIKALVVFSANFALYSDLSDRIMRRIGAEVPALERYSIDECFFEIEKNEAFPVACAIQKALFKELSIPISVGIGRTKTEAKLATRCAKKEKSFKGICDILSFKEEDKRELYANLTVSSLWGINTATEEKLKKVGVFSVLHLLETPHLILKKCGGVSLERVALELQGISCLDIQEEASSQKSLMHSRSFASPLFQLSDMRETVSCFACRAAERLRGQKLFAHMVTLSLIEKTGSLSGMSESVSVPLDFQTNCSIEISKKALVCLDRLYKERTLYKKAAVLLSGLVPEQSVLSSFWDQPAALEKRRSLMHALDDLTSRFGKKALFLGSEGIHPTCSPQSKKSPDYTTSWNELPIVYAR
jgi:DNA polymerase V